MHKKVLQSGDVRGYKSDLTFYAGNVNDEVQDGQGEFANSHIFNVAFGLSDYADSQENIEDVLYGNLVAMKTYRNEDGVVSYETIY